MTNTWLSLLCHNLKNTPLAVFSDLSILMNFITDSYIKIHEL
jgi:hypothetical protein